MTVPGFNAKIHISLILMLACPMAAAAAQYTCTIKSVLGLNEGGLYATHEWENFYLERQFVVEPESGKVISTTALKARLKNFDESYSPRVLRSEDGSRPLEAVTIFDNTGAVTVLQISENSKTDEKPFYYQTYIGMLLSGTCRRDAS